MKKENNSSLLKLLLSPFTIKANAIEGSAEGAVSNYGSFDLVTFIVKNGYNGNGEYLYSTATMGKWSNHSIWEGDDTPSSGEDYIAVTSPLGTTIVKDNLEACYGGWPNEYYNGSTQTKEFRKDSDDTNFVKYNVVDDPFGRWQMDNCALSTEFTGQSSSQTRKVIAYYVHTWDSVSCTFTIDTKISDPYETHLLISPVWVDKSWRLSSYVVFNF